MNTKKSIETLIRRNILSLQPYKSARDEYKGTEGTFLDANENPFGKLNRYPDPYQIQLKQLLSAKKRVPAGNCFIGNGSDEVIDLAIRIFCEPGKDKVIICTPTYGMYKVSANINNVEIISIPLMVNFQPDIDKIIRTNAKILFLCSPNNPTGNTIEDIEYLVQKFNGIVFLDEAYIDFSSAPSFLEKLLLYPNLIISQTLSKAWAHAGIRTGIAFASTEIIACYNKVKPPYNISTINQQAAINALLNEVEIKEQVKEIISERNRLMNELTKIACIKRVYPSDANFILVECDNANVLYEQLTACEIVVRNRSSEIANTLRITVGKQEENNQLLNVLKKICR